MLPTSTSVNAGGIGELFQTSYLLCGQLNLRSLGSLDDVALLGGSNDGQRTLCDGPCDAYLRARGVVLLADLLRLVR